MALTRPVLPSLKVVDASANNTISFQSLGDQFVKFIYEIYDNATSVLVKSDTIYSQAALFIIPSGTLVNGKEYKIRVKTIDNADAESQFSEYMILKCYSDGSARFVNLVLVDGVHQIKNQFYSFRGEYNQVQNVPLKAYRYYVYDGNRKLIKEYPLTYQHNGYLELTIDGFANGNSYFIEMRCYDQYDRMCTTGLIACYTTYRPADIRQVLTLVNDKETASVRIESDIRQLIFKGVGGWHYENNEYINLLANGSKVYLDNAFTLNQEFTFQCWVKRIKKECVLVTLRDIKTHDEIIIKYQKDNRFHAYKKTNGFLSHYISDEVNLTDREYTLWMRQKCGRLDLKVEVM